MLLRISLTLLLCIFSTLCFSQMQANPDIFQIDRTSEKRTCYLPAIYFKTNSAEVEERYMEDMAFIAYLMKKYKKIKIRVQAEVSPNPYDTQVKLLTQERLSYFTWLMKDKFGIKSKRILTTEYTQLTRGFTPYQSTLAMDRRKLACECVWKGK